MTRPTGLPKPGIYPNISWDDYRAWPAVSQSILKLGAETSWRRAKARFDGELPDTDSDAKRTGRAVHSWLLERDRFDLDWTIAQQCSAIIETGDRAGEHCGRNATSKTENGVWLCGTHNKSGRATEVVNRVNDAELAIIRGLERSLYDCPYARLFRQPGGAEVSVSAEINGLPCKARIDRYTPASSGRPAVIWDLKTIPSGEGHEAKLVRRVRDYGMDVQAAWYSNLVHRITGERPAYAWIFVEKSAPYEVIVWKAGLDMMELGQAKLAKYWGDWERCCFEGYWPGYQGRQTDRVPELPPDFRELQAWGIEGK